MADQEQQADNRLSQALHAFEGYSVLTRFFVPLNLALIFSLHMIWVINKLLPFPDNIQKALAFFLGIGFFWSVSLILWCESRSCSKRSQKIVLGIGLGIIAALTFFSSFFSTNVFLLLATSVVMVATAAYTKAKTDNAAYWLFNHNLWLAAGFAIIVGLLLMAGFSLILGTLDYLFGGRVGRQFFSFFNVIAMGVIAPIYWLSLIGKDFTLQVEEGGVYDFTSGAVATIIKYILVPLLLFYTVILYGYSLKILFTMNMPKGQLGWMVLAYGAIGTLTATMAWPSRKTGGRLVSFFWRYWFWLLLVPLALMFLAVYQRIAQYGVTFDRYNLTAAGIWLLTVSLYFIVYREKADLRVIPAWLAFFFFVSSFGFWGATGLSNKHQQNILTQLLEDRGFLKNKVLVKAKERKKDLSTDDQARVFSIVRYLDDHDGLKPLKPWFKNSKSAWFKKIDVTDDQKILKALGAENGYKYGRRGRSGSVDSGLAFRYTATDGKSMFQAVENIKNYDEMMGPIALHHYTSEAKLPKMLKKAVKGQNNFYIALYQNILMLRDKDGNEFSFDFLPVALKFSNHFPAPSPTAEESDKLSKHAPLWLKKTVNGIEIALKITALNGLISKDKKELNYLNVTFLIFRGKAE